ncbi:zinc ABC transporter substrate-binding protein [Ruegeria faecimaris]|uniref:zinc ABC transporter substrate-binding protein n=1 Tax=Ruegeria faecimaris TaxID=686389 RepID=UPI002491F2B4|nr:zinc ABC transporter substrate-binding protein [Ruegeria faecimaris]
MFRPTLYLFSIAFAGQAIAEAPSVAVDIAPVHSLVARVMDGVGEPSLIIPPGASPHDHAMRPSEARSLQSAEIVFWTGEELTPWLAKPLGALSPDALHVSLLDADGTILYEFRDATDHDDHDDRADHDGHDDHADYDDHAGNDDHDDHAGHADDHGHDHEGVDPHAWLDPENARIWVQVIAATLSEADPENADVYQQNAATADRELVELKEKIMTDLTDMQTQSFITFHDAYQYFEKRFGLESSGAVSLGDTSSPGPARLAALREKVEHEGIVCAFSEPQFDTRLVRTAIEGTGATIFELDPVGVSFDTGISHYDSLLMAMSAGYQDCSKSKS